MAKRDVGRALHIRTVSDRLLRQIALEAEAASVTRRAWVLELVCKACGLNPEDEAAPSMGTPSKAKREAARREKAERRAAIAAWEQRTTCGRPGRQAGELFICRLPRDHAGECSPTALPSDASPSLLSQPSLTGI